MVSSANPLQLHMIHTACWLVHTVLSSVSKLIIFCIGVPLSISVAAGVLLVLISSAPLRGKKAEQRRDFKEGLA